MQERKPCINNAKSIKRHSSIFKQNFVRELPESLDTRNIH